MAGFSQGGGVGLTLAQWMIEGEPERDVMAMDVARFGDWITPGYTLPKVIENYQKRFSVSYPNEELPAARPHRTTPMYDIFSGMGAVWGQQFGLEVPNYFATGDEPTFETPSFRRSDAFAATAREVKALRNGVGINELQNFGKYLVKGPNARAWLDRIMAGRVPAKGRLSLTPMLSEKGKLIGDFTMSCLGENLFQLTASYGSQAYHYRWFISHLEDGVNVENISDRRNGFQIAGPNARDVLQSCTRRDISEMKFLDVWEMTVGQANCIVQRVSYTGDLGFEIYCDPMDQRSLWQTLWAAAAGASSRMRGRDKLLEDIDGEPLLRHQALRALAVTDAKVLIALPVSPHPRYNVIDDLAVQTVPVPDAAEGMGASLRVAFASLPKDAPCAMLVLADLPDVTADDLVKGRGCRLI
ncbi:Dimethylglycine dehydrogenase, mitochondrial [Nymphon striatum]|nr:Dimethylglycine dehydrogenase, mitochondrial [Nymphon striatum]